MPPRRQDRQPRRQAEDTAQRQRALLEQVFAALRPPDDVEDDDAAGAAAAGPQFHQALTLEALCCTSDYAESLASHLYSRADLYRLGCTNRAIAAATQRVTL